MMSTRRDFLRTTMSLGGAGLALGALPGIGSLASANAGGYKALVCIHLDGGLDGYDTIFPLDAGAFAAQADARKSLGERYERAGDDSRTLGALRPLGGPQADGRRFGMPRQMNPLGDLYNEGRMAVVANVGPLEEPTSRSLLDRGQGRLPSQLFSHNDQASTWLTSSTEGATSGWGGRVADAVMGGASPFSAIGVDHDHAFLSGKKVRPFTMGREGLAPQYSLAPWAFEGDGIGALIAEHYRASGAALDNYLASDFQASQRRAMDAATTLSEVLPQGTGGEAVKAEGSKLSERLAMVARLIGLRAQLGVGRQVFFVRHEGYDTHDNQAANLPLLQAELAGAVSRFYRETVRMGVADQVTTFTAAEFGRTLNANASGTDHGWGGHHFVVGGAVRGGRIVGAMPEAGLEHDQTLDRGRLIPTMAVDSFAASLALWMGVSPSDLPTVLPKFPRFGNAAALF
jgi:uncharacterized protein (DUF1501 family)